MIIMVTNPAHPQDGEYPLEISRTGERAVIRYGYHRVLVRDLWESVDGSTWAKYSDQYNELSRRADGTWENSFDTRYGRSPKRKVRGTDSLQYVRA